MEAGGGVEGSHQLTGGKAAEVLMGCLPADLEEGDGLIQTGCERHLGHGVKLHGGESSLRGAGAVEVGALLHLDTEGRRRGGETEAVVSTVDRLNLLTLRMPLGREDEVPTKFPVLRSRSSSCSSSSSSSLSLSASPVEVRGHS